MAVYASLNRSAEPDRSPYRPLGPNNGGGNIRRRQVPLSLCGRGVSLLHDTSAIPCLHRDSIILVYIYIEQYCGLDPLALVFSLLLPMEGT